MPSLSAILVILGLLGTIGSGAGAWFYRAKLDAGDVQAALDKRALAEQDSIAKAYEKGQQDSTQLAQDQETRAKQAEQDLAKEKADHANDIKTAHADLVRTAGNCRVARTDVRVLDAPAALPGPAVPSAAAAAGQQRDDSGSVDAVTIIETCERNRLHFDANLAKLEQCIADYNEARSKVNASK